MKAYVTLAIWLAGAIFGAGGAWAAFLRMKKDVNALGRIVRRDRWNLVLALMVMSDAREDRERLAELMRD
jgi:hypothetical protein